VEADVDAILVVLVICETHCEAFVRNDDVFPLYKRRSGGGVFGLPLHVPEVHCQL